MTLLNITGITLLPILFYLVYCILERSNKAIDVIEMRKYNRSKLDQFIEHHRVK